MLLSNPWVKKEMNKTKLVWIKLMKGISQEVTLKNKKIFQTTLLIWNFQLKKLNQ